MPSLGNDLQTLRNRKDLSVEDIKQSTKIPVPILKSIEDDSIFDQIDNNTTYTRSYVRSYARALGVEEKDILKALNQVQTGTYKGSLLGENEAETPESEDDHVKDPPNKKTPAAPSKSETTPDPDGASKEKAKKQPARSRYETSPEDWDWVHVDTTAKVSTKSSNKNWWYIVLIIVVLVVAGLFIYFYYFSPSETTTINGAENSQTTITVPLTPSDIIHPKPVDSRQQLTQNRHLRASAWKRDDNQYNRLHLLSNRHNNPDLSLPYYSRKADASVLNRSIFKRHPEWLPADEGSLSP